jgi:hypothetical protein
MRFVGFCIVLLNLLMLSSPADAKCEKMAEEPPKDRPNIALLHWPEVRIHPHISIETDATQPDGTGTATLYGPIAHAKEVENFYVALFRDRGWKLAPEYQPSNAYIFHHKNRRMTLTSGADSCMGYSLTLHAVPFDAAKYKPEKPFAVEFGEKLSESLPKIEESKKVKKRVLSPEAEALPHNKKQAEAEKEAAKADSEKSDADKTGADKDPSTEKPKAE